MMTLKEQLVQTQEDYRSGGMSKAKIEEPLIKGPTYAYECGYEAGKAEGSRLERRAQVRRLRKFANDWRGVTTTCSDAADKMIRDMLRTKPAKRKEGGR